MIRSIRQRFPVALLVTTAAFIIYLLTLAPDLTWANFGVDGGELITAAVTLGVPHPPGYPLYVLAGKVISYLPVGSIAYRFNLFSAVTVALAAGFVTAAASHLLASSEHKAAAVAGGLSFALMPLVWSQALIAEVYGLNLAFSAALVWALLVRRPPWQVGLLLGLAVTSHLTSLLLLPLTLGLTPYRSWYRLGLGCALGLAPLLALPFLAQTGSPVIWGEPATFSGWWWLVSGRLYHANLLALPLPELWTRLQTWLWLIPAQFLWVGLLFILVGLIQSRASLARPAYWFLGTAALYLLYAAGYATEDAIVLLMPGLMLLSLLLAIGLHRLGWIVLLLPLLLLLLNFNTQRLNDGHSVRPLAEAVLQVMPPDAILLTPGDPTIFTLWYFQHVEGRRPDLVLVDTNLFAFTWYRQRLQDQYPNLSGFERDDLEIFRRLNQAKRPVCRATVATGLIDYSCSMDSS